MGGGWVDRFELRFPPVVLIRTDAENMQEPETIPTGAIYQGRRNAAQVSLLIGRTSSQL